jgi:hypothetical protein
MSISVYTKQFLDLRFVVEKMLLEVGIIEDEDFDFKCAEMARELLNGLYEKYSAREINTAIRVCKSAIVE